jgi:hypothetical protein
MKHPVPLRNFTTTLRPYNSKVRLNRETYASMVCLNKAGVPTIGPNIDETTGQRPLDIAIVAVTVMVLAVTPCEVAPPLLPCQAGIQ